MKGGKLIGQGSFGCVFDPPLLCKDHTKRRDNKISKLLEVTDARTEVKENNKINKIDPTFKWHLKSEKGCIPDGVKYNDNIMDCEIVDTFDAIEMIKEGAKDKNNRNYSIYKNYRNIIQEHGGSNLSSYITKKPSSISDTEKKHKFFIELFLQSENLLLGIKDLFEKDMCHFDIKTDNVVYNEKNKRFNYIDFGLTRKIDDVKNFPSLWRAYWVWPLDTILCYRPYKKNFLDKNNVIRTLDAIKTQYKASYASTVVKNYVSSGNPYMDCLNSERKLTEYLNYIQEIGYDKFVRIVSESIDTFSLGILYMQLMVCFTNKKFDIGICRLDTSLKYYNELKAIHDFINLMLKSNSINRMRASQIYEYFLSNVKPILTGNIKKSVSVNATKLNSVILQSPDLLHEQTKDIVKKVCPDGQILNPKTNRCVSQKGAIGKKLISKKNKRSALINITARLSKSSNNKTKKVCPAGKILNPKTNRCVNVNGAIGKKLV